MAASAAMIAAAASASFAAMSGPRGAGRSHAATPIDAAHRSWTKADRAPRFVQSLAQDRDGFLWVGSADGLFRFDGLDFEKIEAPPGHSFVATPVSALAAAPDGSVWVGYAGRGGVAHLVGGVLRDTKMPDPPAEVTRIVIGPDGEPWIGGGDATHPILHLDGGRWKPFADAERLNDWSPEPSLASRRGTLWFTTWYFGLYFKRAQSQILERVPGRSTRTLTLQEDASGVVWQIDESGLRPLPAYDRGATGPARPAVGRVPPFRILRSTTDATGRIWTTTFATGVFAIRPGEQTVSRFTAADGLSSDRASPILTDFDGNVWVGTERGLDRFSATPIRDVDAVPGDLDSGYMLAKAGSAVYLAAGGTILQAGADGDLRRSFRTAGLIKGLCGGERGDLWAHTLDRMVAVAGPERGTSLKLPARTLEAIGCVVAHDGSLWLAINERGLFRRVDGAWRHVPLPPHLGAVNNIAIDRAGRILVLMNRKDLVRLDGTGLLTFWAGSRTGFERPTAFSSNMGVVLVGGYTGLLRVGERKVDRLDVRDHPWLRDIRGIANGPSGQTWLIGYAGVTRVSTAALMQAFDDPKAFLPHVTFDQDDRRIALPQSGQGLQAATDAAGRTWLLTRAGVLSAREASAPPKRQLRVYVRDIVSNGRSYLGGQDVELPKGSKSLTVRYGAVDLTTPLQRRFRTRLVGAGRQWSDNDDRREITYMGLAPGTYRFEVQTNDNLGGWQPAGAAIRFRIAPAFWQARWFAGLAALLGAFAIWLLYGWRTRALTADALARAEARAGERERIARELHDTLLQSVQGLLLRVQAVVNRMAPEDESRIPLERTLLHASDLLVESRDRVFELRSSAETESFEDLIGKTIDGIHFAPGVTVARRVMGTAKPIRDDAVAEVMAIVREALSNAARHSDASEVLLEIVYGRTFRVSVLDDGTGIPSPGGSGSIGSGFGLVGMQERAEALKAQLQIGPGPYGGTLVELGVPGRQIYADDA